MNFTAPIFLPFLLLVFALHWGVRNNSARLLLLLGASLVFYAASAWQLVALLLFVIGLSWLTALQAASRAPGDPVRRRWLVLGIAGNLAVLAAFKYFGFFQDGVADSFRLLGLEPSWPTLNILLPVGISFYVFQAISYIVDTARGDLLPEPRLSRVALYIGFFPQLVAGPIVRAASFFPQMERERRLSRALLASGGRAILLGLAYKIGLADTLAAYSDPVFGPGGDADLSPWSNAALAGATIAFAGQIYFDFAGYSLMAIGVARLFGFHIPRNFAYPYAASSIADFWRRWHISLSGWLRDYLYIPLGGNRLGRWLTYRNLMLTMLLGGLWHGAAWTFVAWGAIHGAALCLHRWGTPHLASPLPPGLGWLLTQAVVLLAWAFFRAGSFGDAWEVWTAFAGLREGGPQHLPLVVWAVPLILALDAWLGLGKAKGLARTPVLARPAARAVLLGGLAACLIGFYPLDARPFVYFQF